MNTCAANTEHTQGTGGLKWMWYMGSSDLLSKIGLDKAKKSTIHITFI